MSKYTYRQGFRPAVDPEVAGFELERIRMEAEGKLTPADVVDAARPEDAPLHPVFEWDDAEAAEAHRRWQARLLIRSVRIVSDDNKPSAPAYFSVRIQETKPYYQSASELHPGTDEYKAVERQLGAKIASARRSYDDLMDLAQEHEPDKKRRSALAKLKRPFEQIERGLGVQA